MAVADHKSDCRHYGSTIATHTETQSNAKLDFPTVEQTVSFSHCGILALDTLHFLSSKANIHNGRFMDL